MEENKNMGNVIKQVSASMSMEGMTLSDDEKEHLEVIVNAQINLESFDLAKIAKNLKPGESFIEKIYEEVLRLNEEKRKIR